MIQSPETMTAVEAAAAIENGTLKCEALVRACFDRIEAREGVINAWTVTDRARAIATARELDPGPRRGLLDGIPIGVKDIIATRDFPTSYGSKIYAGHRPPADAGCVAILRAAGAILPGKTVTTEFAYFTPGPTANPRNPRHTPGGSSSGSAAAVADAMVPLALGTQTAGSVIRPASFCGIVGFKPTFGRINMAGVKPFAPSLDTLGWMARSVDDLELARAALVGAPYRAPRWEGGRPRVGICRTAEWDRAESPARDALAAAIAAIEREARVADAEFPSEGLVDAQKAVMTFESARSFADEHLTHRDSLSPALRELIELGWRTPYADYVEAHRQADTARQRLREVFARHDVLLSPSAPGEAPAGLDATGDPVFNRIWTLLGVPCITLPAHAGPNGLPVGIQLIGTWDRDRELLGIAEWMARLLRSA
ncbi:MAG: amidase [Betaproteobacteria bacterium]|nr:amidase [Betaproteobacteria bacterium]